MNEELKRKARKSRKAGTTQKSRNQRIVLKDYWDDETGTKSLVPLKGLIDDHMRYRKLRASLYLSELVTIQISLKEIFEKEYLECDIKYLRISTFCTHDVRMINFSCFFVYFVFRFTA
jgi:hypothetical protein